MTRYKLAKALAAAACMVGGGLVVLGVATPASATDNHQVKSECSAVSEFYGNPDEPVTEDNAKSTEAGIELTGAVSLHHTISATKLADLPKHALLTQDVITGSGALVKAETTVPGVPGTYSNIVFTADGVWSSKIAAGSPGGQSNPVDGPEDLIGLWSGYTDDTVAGTIGFGYGNDTGNKTLVKALVFAGKTYNLACKPEPTGTPTAQPTVQPTGTPTAGPGTGNPSTSPTVGTGTGNGPDQQLPRTGPGAMLLKVGGGALLAGILLAAGITVYNRRNRKTYITG